MNIKGAPGEGRHRGLPQQNIDNSHVGVYRRTSNRIEYYTRLMFYFNHIVFYW